LNIPLHSAFATFEGLFNYKVRGISKIKNSTLIISSSNDPLFSEMIEKKLARNIKTSKHVIKRGTHHLIIQNPVGVIEEIEKFIKESCFFRVMLFTIYEIIDILIMTFGVGFIFMDLFDHRQFNKPEDYLKIKSGFAWDRLFFASGIVAPAIILHELGHKFVALSFGFQELVVQHSLVLLLLQVLLLI
jgi:hypothetical protein